MTLKVLLSLLEKFGISDPSLLLSRNKHHYRAVRASTSSCQKPSSLPRIRHV